MLSPNALKGGVQKERRERKGEPKRESEKKRQRRGLWSLMLMLTAVFLGSSMVQMCKTRAGDCVRAEREGSLVFSPFGV